MLFALASDGFPGVIAAGIYQLQFVHLIVVWCLCVRRGCLSRDQSHNNSYIMDILTAGCLLTEASCHMQDVYNFTMFNCSFGYVIIYLLLDFVSKLQLILSVLES